MNYMNTLLSMLLLARHAKLVAHIADRYFCLQSFDRAPDEGRIILSWGDKEGHEAGVALIDYDFVSAYDIITLATRAAPHGVHLDEQHIPLSAWTQPCIREINTFTMKISR